MTKIRKRNKKLNDLLITKRSVRHEFKQGPKQSRAKIKASNKKDYDDYNL